MENYSNCSYPDSRDSSPRSREIDSENPSSWDELPSNYKVKFMCSYGGKIQPRSHDNQLAYVGGDTKILAVDRNVKLSPFLSKLSSLCGAGADADLCFKYQLPGEDLDALISVTNDEDLEHMMLEYDRLYRASAKPARLRLFLFPPPTGFGSNDTKSERQWFMDALNSVQIQSLGGSSPPAVSAASAPNNPDFLFGFDKGYSAVPGGKLPDLAVPPPSVPDSIIKDVSAGSEDRHVVGGGELPVVSPAEIQRQIQDLQRMHIAGGHEQSIFHRKYDEVGNPRAYAGDYYSQNYPEQLAPNPSPVQMPVQVPMQASYVQERHMTTGGYSVSGGPAGTEQQIYFIPTPTGVYQAPASLRPGTGPISQAYYGVQRVPPEVYREAHMYNPAMIPQQQKVGTFMEGMQMQAQQSKIEVAYDGTGRQQVYYTTQGGAVSSYQTAPPVPVEGRQGTGAALNQDGKVVGKASQ